MSFGSLPNALGLMSVYQPSHRWLVTEMYFRASYTRVVLISEAGAAPMALHVVDRVDRAFVVVGQIAGFFQVLAQQLLQRGCRSR